MKTFKIYRWNPDDGQQPTMQTYKVDLRSFFGVDLQREKSRLLEVDKTKALFPIRNARQNDSRRSHQNQKRARSNPDLQTILPRRYLRFMLNVHRR